MIYQIKISIVNDKDICIGMPDVIGRSDELKIVQDIVWSILRLTNPKAISKSNQLGEVL